MWVRVAKILFDSLPAFIIFLPCPLHKPTYQLPGWFLLGWAGMTTADTFVSWCCEHPPGSAHPCGPFSGSDPRQRSSPQKGDAAFQRNVVVPQQPGHAVDLSADKHLNVRGPRVLKADVLRIRCLCSKYCAEKRVNVQARCYGLIQSTP